MPAQILSEIDLRQLSDRLQRLRQTLPLHPPADGWLKTVRRALGIRTTQLATRLGVSQPGVIRTEEREVTGAISLQTLRRFANELDCDLVYYLIPRSTLVQQVEHRAELIAGDEAAEVAQSLILEWGLEVPTELLEQVERERDRLVAERPARLWDPVNGD